MLNTMKAAIAAGATVGGFTASLLTIEVVTFFWSGTTAFYDTQPLLNAAAFAVASLAGLACGAAVLSSRKPSRAADCRA